MSKKVSSELTGIVLTFGILSSFIGIKETFNIIKQIFSFGYLPEYYDYISLFYHDFIISPHIFYQSLLYIHRNQSSYR